MKNKKIPRRIRGADSKKVGFDREFVENKSRRQAMNRRDFLKNAFALAAFAPLLRLGANEPMKTDEAASPSKARVVRRRYKNTDLTLPLLGFGMMRLPRISPEKPDIDYAVAEQQIARALEAGCNYFDTAYFYHDGLSEKCVGDLLSKHPRSSYLLADKMPVRALKKEEDVERIWNEQLEKCKTDYFDFYLLHNLNRDRWEDVKRFHVYEFLKKKQEEGKIRKLGFSFHDKPEVLKIIAEAHPWDFAQIQLNYLDWTLYRSKEQYEILTKLGIPVIVMEPLRGGALASLNPEATKIFKLADPDASVASWAMRYAASLPNVLCVLSGMTLPEHLEDNIKTFSDFKPLDDADREVVRKALEASRKNAAVPCTDCRYCMPCPAGVDIPRIFGLYNQAKAAGNVSQFKRNYMQMPEDERASACVECGACLKKCPQKIQIPAQLKKIESEFSAKTAQLQPRFWSPDDECFV